MEVYNTLTREIEEFQPRDDREVKMYVCGPTVYDYCHIGHARTWIAFDMLVRYLRHRGYKVDYVVNITDIDDKIVRRASEIGEDPLKLAKKFEEAFHEDVRTLGLLEADSYPRVTEHITDIVEMIEELVHKGYAYEVDGDVYFDVTRVTDYGKLSNQSLEDLQAGARVEVDEKKKHPADFALWKKAKEGEPSWVSLWGRGRPGWHIECSAMSSKHLGGQIDIHGGGRDLIFPHHENEIAQSEACSGKKPFVKYWIHAGFLTIDGEKMSKSLGNFITIRELLGKVDPDIFKLMLLSTHYRSPIDYNEKALLQSARRLRRISSTLESLERRTEESESTAESKNVLLPEVERAKSVFYASMDDDLNTSKALASLSRLVRAANRALNRDAPDWELMQFAETIRQLTDILGLLQETKKERDLSERAKELIEMREEARKSADWDKADALRQELESMGVLLEDTPEGPKWRVEG